MRDINTEAQKALSGLSCETVYYYPESFNELPIVSYYNLTESGAFSSDNSEDIQQGVVVVDIWARDPMRCGSVGIEVNAVMSSDGWAREFSMDIAPEDKREPVFHRTMRFIKEFLD